MDRTKAERCASPLFLAFMVSLLLSLSLSLFLSLSFVLAISVSFPIPFPFSFLSKLMVAAALVATPMVC